MGRGQNDVRIEIEARCRGDYHVAALLVMT